MNEPPPLPETPAPAAPAHPPMSLAARLMNVFAVPGEVFGELKTAKHSAANWLVPVLIGCVVGIASVIIVFSQPAIQQKVLEKQQSAVEKKFDELVKAGKMTQEQANQQMDFMERYGPMLAKISGSVGVIIYGFVRVFFWGLVLWLTGRWLLKAPFGYLKGVEVAGLAGMIGVLGAIVALLLRVNFSNPMASPSLALTVGEFDPKNMLHVLLAMVDLFDLWQVGVMGAGLARLAGAPFARATLPVLVCWMVISAAFGALSSLAARFGS